MGITQLCAHRYIIKLIRIFTVLSDNISNLLYRLSWIGIFIIIQYCHDPVHSEFFLFDIICIGDTVRIHKELLSLFCLFSAHSAILIILLKFILSQLYNFPQCIQKQIDVYRL